MKKQFIQLAAVVICAIFCLMPIKTEALAAEYANVTNETSTIEYSGLSTSELTLEVGKTKKLKLNNTKGKIKWSSNKKSVAKVSKKGVVSATGVGKAVITAKVGKEKYTCEIFCYKVNNSNEKVRKKVSNIIKNNVKASMSQVEMVKAIHDYMILNCEYDYENYRKGSIPRESYGVEGVILKKKAVCQGYAETFLLFMESMGFPCQMVTGTANGGGHAWNCVQVDKKWYQIDVTWDDPVPDKKGRTRYEYFLIPDSKMDDDHVWNKSAYPKSKTSNNKFITLFGEISKTREEAIQNLYEQYVAGKDSLQLIYTKKFWESNGRSTYYFDMLAQYNLYENNTGGGYYSYSIEEYGKYVMIHIYPQ